jgi:diguanylate cyclase (GGDEF)-like protein
LPLERGVGTNWRLWLRAASQGTTYFGFGMIALIWLSVHFHLAVDRERTQQAAIQNSSNLARAFEEHLTRSLKDIDKSLLFLRENYLKQPARFDIASLVQSVGLLGDPLSNIGIIGPDGFVRIASPPLPRGPIHLGDREHFQVHVDARDDQLFISKPVSWRAVGTPTREGSHVRLTRGMRNPDGSFAGVVSASLDPYHFARFYETIDVGSEGLVAVIGEDGVVRAFAGRGFDALGRTVHDPQLREPHLSKNPTGWYFSQGAWADAGKRLVSYRKVKGFPLTVAVGLSERDYFASDWRKERAYQGVANTLTLLILLVVALSFWDRAKLELAREEIHTQNARFDAALNNMSQGLCMFDADQRVAVCNERYARMYGLSPDSVKPGTTLRQVIEGRIAKGIYAGADPQDYLRERLAPVTARSIDIHNLSDGRAIMISRQPTPGGGWVTTHEDVTERQRIEAQIAHMAHHDALTELANRVLLRERMEEALNRWKRNGEGFAIFLLDLDHFKTVNDTLGHSCGDELLKTVARRLTSCVRETDTVARLGGDEFAIIQSEVGRHEDTNILAERLLKIIGEPFELDGNQVFVAASMGIALAPDDGTDVEQLLKNADLALYRAKADGRNRSCFFETEMNAIVQHRRSLELALRHALTAGQFELQYQPIISLANNEIRTFEALLRWHHPERGLLLPGEFVPLAEEIGLILPLGEWVLRQACAQAATWPRAIRVAVNLSSAHFRTGNIVNVVMSALASSGLSPDRLELEITETVLLQEDQQNLAMLHNLRDMGVSIALDDFGTGYASLSYLQTFPFDKIKIDKSFVGALGERSGSTAIIHAVVALGRDLGMTTTAEGVETRAQLEELRTIGCTEAQGQLLGPPRPVRELPHLFAQAKPAARIA